MTKNILFLLTGLLLSINLEAQTFSIPTMPKKETFIVDKGNGKNEKITNSKKIEHKSRPGKAGPRKPTGNPELDYTTGTDVEGIERSVSVEELEERARQGDTKAHTNLGMYYYRLGDDKALTHLKAGAESKDPNAQYFLGGAYYNGMFGLKTNKATAVSLFVQSAQQGHAPAQYALAVCYYNGEGIEKNREKAREWMNKASDNGFEDAKTFIETHDFD